MRIAPATVIEVFSPKDKNVVAADIMVHALIEFPNGNSTIAMVEEPISKEIKKGDIIEILEVIQPSGAPGEQKIVRILRGKLGTAALEQFKKTQKIAEERQKAQPHSAEPHPPGLVH